MNEDTKLLLMLISMVLLSLIAGALLMYSLDSNRMNQYGNEVSNTIYKVQQDCKNAYLKDIQIIESDTKFVIELKEENE